VVKSEIPGILSKIGENKTNTNGNSNKSDIDEQDFLSKMFAA